MRTWGQSVTVADAKKGDLNSPATKAAEAKLAGRLEARTGPSKRKVEVTHRPGGSSSIALNATLPGGSCMLVTFMHGRRRLRSPFTPYKLWKCYLSSALPFERADILWFRLFGY